MEPLKTKYATEAAEAFKKMIKNKQPKKEHFFEDGTDFFGAFRQLCTKRRIHLKYAYSGKSQLLQRGTLNHSNFEFIGILKKSGPIATLKK